MALATDTTPGEVILNGDIHASDDPLVPELTPTGVTAGTYNFPHVVVDGKGRILYVKQATVDDVPCATDASCGVAKIGETFDPPVNGLADLKLATISSAGVVKIGDRLVVNSGLVSVQQTPATVSSLGLVKLGQNVSIEPDGTLGFGGEAGVATTTIKGLVQIGDRISVNTGIISANTSTNTTLGVTKPEDTNNITILSGEMDVGTNIAMLNSSNTFTGSQSSGMQLFNNASGSISLDANQYDVFKIIAAGDVVISSINNAVQGQQIDIIAEMGDLVTEYTLTLPTNFVISGNATIGHTTLITCTKVGTSFYAIIQPYMV